jgi:serine protease Do
MRVKKPSDASERGLQPGDVVVAINQNSVTDVKTAAQIVAAAKAAKKKFILLLVNHQGDTRFIPLPLVADKK